MLSMLQLANNDKQYKSVENKFLNKIHKFFETKYLHFYLSKICLQAKLK